MSIVERVLSVISIPRHIKKLRKKDKKTDKKISKLENRILRLEIWITTRLIKTKSLEWDPDNQD